MSETPQSNAVFFGEPHLTQQPAMYQTGQEPPFEQHFKYINHLPVAVTVELRSGLKLVLPPIADLSCNRLIVRMSLYIRPSVKSQIQRLLSAVNDTANAQLKLYKQSFILQAQANPMGGLIITVDYPISLDQLRDLGGTVYYHELDVLFSLLPFDKAPAHPYSPEGLETKLINTTLKDKTNAFTYAIRLIDNGKKHGDRYINIGGSVYRITAEQDAGQRDGIYILSNAVGPGLYGVLEKSAKHYPFEGSDEALGLHLTPEEAYALGDLSTARKRELGNIEHQLNVQKMDIQVVRQEHDKEMAKKNSELARLEANNREQTALLERERGLAVAEQQRLKDYYESKSHMRKDSSEAVKLIPSIVMGIAAVIMTLRAFL